MAIPDEQLRAQVNNYFLSVLPRNPKEDDKARAVAAVISAYPVVLDYYIKYKEEHGQEAEALSTAEVNKSEQLYIAQIRALVTQLSSTTNFYGTASTTYGEAMARVQFLRHVIEDNDGYRRLYLNGKPIASEKDLHIMYKLTWFAAAPDVNQEVNMAVVLLISASHGAPVTSRLWSLNSPATRSSRKT